MPTNSSRSPSRTSSLTPIALLLVITLLGVSLSTAADITLEAPKPASHALTVDERTYYEFVAPRLDRLVLEVDAVATMVNSKSRDIIALTVSGDRIEELAHEIVEFGETRGVPPRFAGVHSLIKGGTDTLASTFGEARLALRRFNFSQMSRLVEEFNRASDTLHQAQDQMVSLVGSKTAIGNHG